MTTEFTASNEHGKVEAVDSHFIRPMARDDNAGPYQAPTAESWIRPWCSGGKESWFSEAL